MTLYKIEESISNLINEETGEVIDVATLENLAKARDIKLENIALFIKNLEADAISIKVEEKLLEERRKRKENLAASLTVLIGNSLCGESFETTKVSLSFRKSTSLQVQDENIFIKWAKTKRVEFLTFPEPKLNKKKIKEVLKAGEVITGVNLVEKLNLQIK